MFIWSTLKLAGSWQKHLVVVFFFPYIKSSNLVVSPFLLISSVLNKAKGFKSIRNIHTVGVCYTKPGWVEWGIAFGGIDPTLLVPRSDFIPFLLSSFQPAWTMFSPIWISDNRVRFGLELGAYLLPSPN